MKPMIGVCPLYDVNKESVWILPSYMKALECAGAIPLLLPLTSKKKILSQIAGRLDGFLFPGGEDIDPACYGQEPYQEGGLYIHERDAMEKHLMQQVIVRDKPLLAICRGHQMLNVVCGGSLIQDIPSMRQSPLNHHQEKPYDVPVHEVTIIKDSPIARLQKNETAWVNSIHHQAVDHVGNGLKCMAYSSDGIVEAMYMPDKSFVWSVQWHPELMKEDGFCQAIFDAFVRACDKNIK
jgi:putative glutamine amidotransferase